MELPRDRVADVLGVPVVRISTNEFMQWLLDEVQGQPGADAELHDGDDIFSQRRDAAATLVSAETTPLFITYLNAACSNIAADDDAYRRILQQADCVYADGQAIVWAAAWLGRPLPERVNAGDFIVRFCHELARRGLRLGLLGGRPGVAASAAAAWLDEIPSLSVAGAWDGFFTDDEKRINAINAAGIDVLLVGMSAPLQEKWAWENRGRLRVKAIWCVGALFEYYGEGRARAPVWMRRAGLEWLFRLALEPRRLWRRYILGNSRFVARLAREKRRLRAR